jgi:hypothetical protein
MACMLLGSGASVAATYKVGTSAGCTHANLPLALAAAAGNPGADEIQLPKNLTYTGEFFIESPVHLRGGFATCASTTPSGRTTVTRAANERVFTIQNAAGLVILEDLNLNFPGGVSAVLAQGGVIHLTGAANILLLQNTYVLNGTAGDGAGIFVQDARLILSEGSLVAQNRASLTGGGILCRGGQVELQSGGVAVNEADYGAGIALELGCTGFAWGSDTFEGIYQNEATEDGGGLYLTGGSDFELLGDSQHPALLIENTANRGGGAYSAGPGSDLIARDAHIESNHAVELGGGVFLGQFGYLLMERTLGSNCHDPVRCSSLSNNSTDSMPFSGYGGAITVDRGYAHINQTYVENNTSWGAAVARLYVGDSQLSMEGSVVHGNSADPGTELIHMGGGTTTRIRYSTFGNNGGLTMFQDSGTNTSVLQIHSSVLYDQAGSTIYGGASPNPPNLVDCSLVSSVQSFQNFVVTRTALVSPGFSLFVNPPAGDYHLRPDSQAIDRCDASVVAPQYADIDGDSRGYDHPLFNIIGPYDLGADETGEPPLFADGFESGNTSGWSSP